MPTFDAEALDRTSGRLAWAGVGATAIAALLVVGPVLVAGWMSAVSAVAWSVPGLAYLAPLPLMAAALLFGAALVVGAAGTAIRRAREPVEAERRWREIARAEGIEADDDEPASVRTASRPAYSRWVRATSFAGAALLVLWIVCAVFTMYVPDAVSANPGLALLAPLVDAIGRLAVMTAGTVAGCLIVGAAVHRAWRTSRRSTDPTDLPANRARIALAIDQPESGQGLVRSPVEEHAG